MISRSLQKEFELLCDLIQELSGIDPKQKTRNWDVVSARMMIANTLYEQGATQEQIGKLFGISHATIYHYRKRMSYLHSPGWQAEKELYQKFMERYEKIKRQSA